ncbi:MAG: ferritin family protein [Candidatus Aminicenantales bacterium]
MRLKNFEDVVNFGIKREEGAIKSYTDMMGMAENRAVKELLQELRKEERNHKKLLQELTEGKVKSYQPRRVLNLKISDYTEEEKLSVDMDFQDLLIVAARKEQQAVDLYSCLARESQSDELKKLFQFLIEQEKSHKLKLEVEYEKYVLQED